MAVLAAGGGVALAADRAIARQQAKTVAAAIVLRHGDLPSYTQSPNPVTRQEERISARLSKCTGATPDSAALAKVQSPNFDSPGGGSISVGSTALIQSSATTVAHDLKAVTAPKALNCLASQLSSTLQAALAGKATLLSLNGSRIQSVIRGSDGTFAFRFAFVLGVKQGKTTVKVPAYGDFVGFIWGQAEVSLSIESELSPPSAALERHSGRGLSRAHGPRSGSCTGRSFITGDPPKEANVLEPANDPPPRCAERQDACLPARGRRAGATEITRQVERVRAS